MKETLGVGAIIGIILVVLIGCGIGGFIVDSLVFQHVTAPIQRTNLNNDPNYQRTIAQDFTNTYNDFQNAQNAIPADAAALSAFSKTYGDPHSWTFQEQQTYGHLLTVWQGDYQAEAMLSAHYNELLSNPDKRQWRPASLPATPLVSDTMPSTIPGS